MFRFETEILTQVFLTLKMFFSKLLHYICPGKYYIQIMNNSTSDQYKITATSFTLPPETKTNK